MADHALVTWALETLADDYEGADVATSTPVLVDDGDGTVYSIAGGTLNDQGRRYSPDVADTNVVTVDPSPDRQDEWIGTAPDFDVTDAVNVLVEGLHEDETGEIASPAAFGDLWKEVWGTLVSQVTSYPTVNGVDYHTVAPVNAGRPPEDDDQAHYFAYSFDLEFRGYEELP